MSQPAPRTSPPRQFAVAALLAVAAFAVADCGRKAPPLPAPQMIPAQTLDLVVQQRGEEVLLRFTYPTVTIAGLALDEVSKVELLELVRQLPPPTPAYDSEEGGEAAAAPPAPVRKEDRLVVDPYEFDATARVVLSIEGEELDSAVDADHLTLRVPFSEPPPVEDVEVASDDGAEEDDAGDADGGSADDEDEDAGGEAADAGDEATADEPPEWVYVYAVRTISGRGLSSNTSNLARLVRREPPAPPENFRLTPEAGGIRVAWGPEKEPPREDELGIEDAAAAPPAEDDDAEEDDADEGILSYRVYRRDARSRAYGNALRTVLPPEREVLDTSARYGERYIYAVTAVSVANPIVESALSTEREVDYDDRFAPPAPRNLVALVEADSVRLIWDASTADDVAGYTVWRRTPDGEREQISTEPIKALEYTDAGLASGAVYLYSVSAFDEEGNEGGIGREVEVRVP